MKSESLGVSLTGLILTVSFIVSVGAILGATGYLAKNKELVNQPQQFAPVFEPTITSTPIVKDETADWKTYKNPEGIFSFKYPANWNIENESGSIVSVGSGNDNAIMVGAGGGSPNTSLEDNVAFLINSLDKIQSSYRELDNLQIRGSRVFFEPARLDGVKQVYIVTAHEIISVVYTYYRYPETTETEKEKFLLEKFMPAFALVSDSNSFSCGISTVTDIDNNIYNTVQIGTQCWLKENLKVTKNPAGEVITRYCYNNDPKICETDGGLYDWNTAMNNSTLEGAQGICPNGWHVPKDSEWYVLEKGLSDGNCLNNREGFGCDSAGKKLKVGGSNGFNAILTGEIAGEGFGDRGINATFWSSTESDKYNVWRRYLTEQYQTESYSGIDRLAINKTYSFSVRCFKD